MTSVRSSTLWLGVFMVAAGGLWLLDSFGIFSIDAIWVAALFGVAGLGLGYVGVTDQRMWWATIPAGTLVGIGAVVAWNRLNPSAPGEWGAALLLVAMGAGFWAAYVADRDRWWAIIPGGMFMTIGLFVGLTTLMPTLQAVGSMLLGFALTVGLVAAVPSDRGRMLWALLPSAILAAVGFLFLIEVAPLLEPLDDYVWPVALLIGGVVVLWRIASRPSKPQP